MASSSSSTISQFLDLTVGQLQHFLRVRGLPTSGTKIDLASRALVAKERNIIPRGDLKQLESELQSKYNDLLLKLKVRDPKDPNIEWKTDVSLWPTTDIGKIFQFIISNHAFEADYVGQYKNKKAYSYFLSGFVHTLFVSVQGDKVVLKCKVTPSQKVHDTQREVWIVCEKSGLVLGAHCTCTAGFSECCNHVISVLYKIEHALTNGFINPACTTISCQWNARTGVN